VTSLFVSEILFCPETRPGLLTFVTASCTTARFYFFGALPAPPLGSVLRGSYGNVLTEAYLKVMSPEEELTMQVRLRERANEAQRNFLRYVFHEVFACLTTSTMSFRAQQNFLPRVHSYVLVHAPAFLRQLLFNPIVNLSDYARRVLTNKLASNVFSPPPPPLRSRYGCR
jgi:hypothetical protein